MLPDETVIIEYKQPKDHAALKRMVENCLDLTKSAATEAKTDRDYYDGKQISARMLTELKKRGQPPLYINMISSAVNGLFGIIDAAASDPEAMPRTASGQDAADVATKTLRYLADKTDFKKVKRDASSNFIVEGCAAAMVEFDDRDGVMVHRIRWEDFLYDPLSKEHDFSDATWLGYGKLLSTDEAMSTYGLKFEEGEASSGDLFDFNDEDAKAHWWGTRDNKLVRVIDIYYRARGDWHRAIFTGSRMLYADVSGYDDDQGRSICPIKATSYEVSRSGDRYGVCRHMRPIQDDVNARRSKLLHHVNHRQLVQSELTVQNVEQARREAARADGVVPFGYQLQTAPDMAQGQFMILQQAQEELNRMAPTPAVLGRLSGANESGRARQILQQAGYTELARAFGRFEAWEAELYRTMWFCARQHLTEPMAIRLADDPRAMEFLTINEPIKAPAVQPVMGPDGQPVVNPMTGFPVTQTVMAQVGQRNRIAELDMDIVLTTVPDTTTLSQESFDALLEYASATKMSPLAPEFALLIEMSPMANKREILERLEAFRTQAAQQQQPDPHEEEAKSLALDGERAKVELDRSKAFKNITSAQRESADMVRQGLGLE